jgi:hypothetical protein
MIESNDPPRTIEEQKQEQQQQQQQSGYNVLAAKNWFDDWFFKQFFSGKGKRKNQRCENQCNGYGSKSQNGRKNRTKTKITLNKKQISQQIFDNGHPRQAQLQKSLAFTLKKIILQKQNKSYIYFLDIYFFDILSWM